MYISTSCLYSLRDYISRQIYSTFIIQPLWISTLEQTIQTSPSFHSATITKITLIEPFATSKKSSRRTNLSAEKCKWSKPILNNSLSQLVMRWSKKSINLGTRMTLWGDWSIREKPRLIQRWPRKRLYISMMPHLVEKAWMALSEGEPL